MWMWVHITAFCSHLRHVAEIRGTYRSVPWDEHWLGSCVDGSRGSEPVSTRTPLNKTKKLRMISDKVGVGEMMNVGLVSIPLLGFPEAIVVELPHKTQEAAGLEAGQQQHLALNQIFLDNYTIAPAVPRDSTNFCVVD